MITWAICWLLAQAVVNATSGRFDLPSSIIVITGMLDVVIIFFVACTVRGWPKF